MFEGSQLASGWAHVLCLVACVAAHASCGTQGPSPRTAALPNLSNYRHGWWQSNVADSMRQTWASLPCLKASARSTVGLGTDWFLGAHLNLRGHSTRHGAVATSDRRR